MSDTAGIRGLGDLGAVDTIEREGISRSKKEFSSAHIALMVCDASTTSENVSSVCFVLSFNYNYHDRKATNF